MKTLLSYLKRLQLMVFLVLPGALLHAQWVSIPPSFAAYIGTYINPASVNGNLLDTTNTSITGLQNLSIGYNAQVTDITGIQYFDNLQNLVFYSLQSSTVPLLPPNLVTFECGGSNLSNIANPWPVTLTSLKLSIPNVSTLPSFPPALQNLRLYSINMATIPTLPSTLTKLDVEFSNGINSVPALPNGLTYLTIASCPNFSNLPALPNSLEHIDLSATAVSSIPAFPAALNYFRCFQCGNITSLPNCPPPLKWVDVESSGLLSMGQTNTYMDYLNLSHTPISAINYLPDTVLSLYLNDLPNLYSLPIQPIVFTTVDISNSHNAPVYDFLDNLVSLYNGVNLYASSDSLGILPPLPSGIYDLDLSDNPLGYFSGFSNPTTLYSDSRVNLSYCQIPGIASYAFNQIPVLGGLDLSNNNLSSLASVPIVTSPDLGYGVLNLSNNQFSSLTFTPAAKVVDVRNNQLSCLPFLESFTRELYVSGNSINCLPNIPDTGFQCDLNIGVCLPGNTNNCIPYSNATGTVFQDANLNGILDPFEPELPGYYVRMDNINAYRESDSAGTFGFQCDNNIAYNIVGLPTYPYRQVTTPNYPVFFTIPGQLSPFKNIGIYIQSNVNDLLVELTPLTIAYPGFDMQYMLTVKNRGTTTQSGNLQFNFDNALWYQSSLPPATQFNNTLSWSFSNLQPLQTFSTTANFILPATVPLGQQIWLGAHANGLMPDTVPTDNNDTLLQVATGSYDPNFKEVTPAAGLTLQELQNGKYLTYTIHFQNTGTAPAIHVRLEDTLSALLDLNTFEVIDAGHAYSWVIENRVLKVFFNNIQLPDSGTNYLLSNGFFKYRIKSLASLQVADVITNTAYIYFDFNAPVQTNITSSGLINYFVSQPQDVTACVGTSPSFSVQTTAGIIAQQWFKNGQPLNANSSTCNIPMVALSDTGFYSCTIFTDGGEYYQSDSAKLTVFPAPVVSSIYQSGDTLWCNSAENIVWMLNGSAIEWETNNFYVPAQAGWYNVLFTTDSGCTALGAQFYYAPSAIPANSIQASFLLIPNPAKNSFTLFSNQSLKGCMLQLFNPLGQVILTRDLASTANPFDVSGLASGLYFVNLTLPDGTRRSLPLIKE